MVISTYLEGPSRTAVGSILSIDPAPVSNDIMLAEKKYPHPYIKMSVSHLTLHLPQFLLHNSTHVLRYYITV